MSNYINTPVYSNQLSKKHMNKNNKGFYFLKLNAPETLNSKTIKEKYGNVKAISIIVPDFAVKGSVIAKESDKVYKLDKDKEGKVVDFNPLILDENKKKVDGKHILATVSLKLPEDEKELNDETKVKVVLSVFNEETKTYENKQMTTSYKKLSEDLFKQNTKSVSESIKKYKDSAKDIFNEAELAKEIEKEEKVNNVEYDLIDDAISR